MKKLALAMIICLCLTALAAQATVFDLDLRSPREQEYGTRYIPLSIRTGQEVNISYYLDNVQSPACVNCKSYETLLKNLSLGEHTLKVIAAANGSVENKTVTFRINVTKHPEEVHENTKEFSHLPELLASGNLTNEQLIDLMEDHRLPPGILNRLIKTGNLSSNAITTMIETQVFPQGIMAKLFGWWGLGNNKLAEDLLHTYNLTEEQFSLLLEKQKIPPGTASHIMKSANLTTGQIMALINVIDEKESRPRNMLYRELIREHTLSDDEILNLINASHFKGNILKELLRYQKLSNESIEAISGAASNSKELWKELAKNQKLNDKQKEQATHQLEKRIERAENNSGTQMNQDNLPNDTHGKKVMKAEERMEKAEERVREMQERIEEVKENNSQGIPRIRSRAPEHQED